MANPKITDNPLLSKVPQNGREMRFFAQALADFILLDAIPGRVASQRNLPMVRIGNRGSVQSALVLNSADEGATANITIDSHFLNDDVGAITYHSGTITGLTFDTKYYVYTDDADFEGGAVTYLASLDPSDMVRASGRYYLGAIVTQGDGEVGEIGGGGGGGAGSGEDPGDGNQWP